MIQHELHFEVSSIFKYTVCSMLSRSFVFEFVKIERWVLKVMALSSKELSKCSYLPTIMICHSILLKSSDNVRHILLEVPIQRIAPRVLRPGPPQTAESPDSQHSRQWELLRIGRSKETFLKRRLFNRWTICYII